MPKKYRPKIKGYVLPYIYVDNRLLFLISMERLKEPGEYYGTLLGGTSKNLRDIRESTVRELCEETRGYMQIDKSDLIEYSSFNDKDRCTIYLLPLLNNQDIVYEINAFKNGVLMPPECSESSFIIALGIDELLSWADNTQESSPPYYYFRKPFINKYPLQSYKKFMQYFQNISEYSSNTTDEDSREIENIFLQEESSEEKEDLGEASDHSDSSPLPLETEKAESIINHGLFYRKHNLITDRHRDEPASEYIRIKPKERIKIWIGERLTRVLRNVNEDFLEQKHHLNAIFYKYVDKNICKCISNPFPLQNQKRFLRSPGIHVVRKNPIKSNHNGKYQSI